MKTQYIECSETVIQRVSDSAFIPKDEMNEDYREFLMLLANDQAELIVKEK